MKITGTSWFAIFDLENGYKIKADGEFIDRGFAVDAFTMKHWEPPHENEPVTQEQIDAIIAETEELNKKPHCLQVIFDAGWKTFFPESVFSSPNNQ